MNTTRYLFNNPLRENISTSQTVTLIGLAGLTTLLLVVIPWLSPFNYSLRLLMTTVHELGHGLAALLTGGDFIRFVVYADGSGLAYTAGGWRFVVIPAGYLGAALFGAILITLGRNQQRSRIALALIGVMLGLLCLRYGPPNILTSDWLWGLLTTLFGIIFGVFLVWVALKAPTGWIIFLIHLIAIRAGLTSFSDLIGLIGLSSNFFGMSNNDARSMASLTFIPALIWALLWTVAALLLIGGAIWITWLAPQPETIDTSPRHFRLQ
jgi:hypothetical protein